MQSQVFALQRLIEDDTNNDLGNPQFYMANQDFAAIIPIAIYYVSYFYYRPNHTEEISIQHFEDIKGHTIGILKGTIADRTYFNQRNIVFEESYSQDSLFKKLKLGRIDLSVEIDLVGLTTIKRLFPEELDNFGSILFSKSATPIAILLSEDYPNAQEIAEKYREGLKRIIKNGTYQTILEKYYGEGGIPSNWFKELQRYKFFYDFEVTE